MKIRETAIAKIQQLPESLVQEIIDFIDLITHNRQAKTAINSLEGVCSEAWARWFEAIDFDGEISRQTNGLGRCNSSFGG